MNFVQNRLVYCSYKYVVVLFYIRHIKSRCQTSKSIIRDSIMDRFMSHLIPSLVKDGVFGDVQFVAVEPDQAEFGAQYGSNITFVNLTLKGESGEEILPLVVKRQIEDNAIREWYHTSEQFYNEFVMYKELIPQLGVDRHLFPKLYYASVTEGQPEKDVFILENLKRNNFRSYNNTLFLDFSHISLAMKLIAKFHSFSYILKHENPERFMELARKLKKRPVSEEIDIIFEIGHFASIERGVKASKNQSADVVDDFLRTVRCPLLVWEALSSPEEPFSVICHGDFCNNNVMYKYDHEGLPTDCILIDFQLAKYGTPAIELAFYLYMHTDAEMRENHWDDFLKIYWDTLRECVPNHIELPKFEDFQRHFATRAMYGYIISSFFIPMMIDGKIKFWGGLPIEKHVEINRTMGGKVAEEKIGEVFDHIFKRKYIHAFLDFSKTQTLER